MSEVVEAVKVEEAKLIEVVTPKPLNIIQAPMLKKLDLASGQRCAPGFEGVDVAGGAQHKVDLMKFPWPWANNSVDELNCSHFIEHIQCRPIEKRDLSNFVVAGINREDFVDRDMFLAFFDECWRIMKVDSLMTIHCPNARSNRAFQDPTHRRFIVYETFYYLNAQWREQAGLDHYNVKCNFGFDAVPIIPQVLSVKHPEAQKTQFDHYWNSVLDWKVTLKKLPPYVKPPAQ